MRPDLALPTGHKLRPLAREALPALIFLAFVLVPVLARLIGEEYLISLFARMMIFAIAAVSLDLLVGFGGLISFGHAAFIGLGAYAVGILSAHGLHDATLSLPAALLASALFALLTGFVC